MEIGDRAAIKEPSYRAQHGIAEISMQQWHGTALDPALEAVADDEIIARLKPIKERIEAAEIVAVVGISHDDELSTRCRDARSQRTAITALRHGNDTRSQRLRDLARAVAAAVIGDDDLARKILSRKIGARFCNTGGQCPRLVEARHQDAQGDLLLDARHPKRAFPRNLRQLVIYLHEWRGGVGGCVRRADGCG